MSDSTQNQSEPQEKPATPTTGAVEMPFQAEVQQVLSLVIHSLYANKDVFLRELISNASDALDRARYLALTREDVAAQHGEPGISIRLDDDARTLTIEDNGIGMTRDEVVANLGTIARSGSLEFLRREAEAAKARGELKLIGQFGVGFYAAFMVASRVDVHTRSMLPGATPVLWRSQGAGTFSILPGERIYPGTTVVLHLKEEDREYTKAWRVKGVIEKYSDFVSFPIRVGDEVVNRSKALWTLPKAQITEEQHAEFYHHVSGHLGDAPLARVHVSVDAPVQFHALLYVPEKAPHDVFQHERRGIRLYAKRVLIVEECDKIVPTYLRFLRGVVDSEDLALNVSREMLQENKTLQQIEQQLTKQVLKTLKEVADERPDDYLRFWRELGRVLKEGIALDWKNKDAIVELCRFESLRTEPGKYICLRQYVDAMPDGQREIFFLTGPSRRHVEQSPHLEAFRKKGYDVLFLVDPIDEWVAQSLPDYAKHKLKSVTHGEVDLGGDGTVTEADPSDALAAVTRVLGDRVKQVRLSRRLTDSASCLVAGEGDAGANLERIMKMVDKEARTAKKILELNPSHPIVKNLDALAKRDPASERLASWSELLYEQALLAEGIVEDPARLVRHIQDLLSEVSATAARA